MGRRERKCGHGEVGRGVRARTLPCSCALAVVCVPWIATNHEARPLWSGLTRTFLERPFRSAPCRAHWRRIPVRRVEQSCRGVAGALLFRAWRVCVLSPPYLLYLHGRFGAPTQTTTRWPDKIIGQKSARMAQRGLRGAKMNGRKRPAHTPYLHIMWLRQKEEPRGRRRGERCVSLIVVGILVVCRRASAHSFWLLHNTKFGESRSPHSLSLLLLLQTSGLSRHKRLIPRTSQCGASPTKDRI